MKDQETNTSIVANDDNSMIDILRFVVAGGWIVHSWNVVLKWKRQEDKISPGRFKRNQKMFCLVSVVNCSYSLKIST